MKIVILIRTYFSQYTLLFWCCFIFQILDITCIYKSLLLGVLCANFCYFLTRYGHSIAPGELVLRDASLKPERSRNISWKMFVLVPEDDLCNPDEVFEVFVDIDSNISVSKDPYLASGRSIIVRCLFLVVSYCSLS